MSSDTLLSVSGLTVSYGTIQAVKGISLEVNRGEMVCIIGCNGAGKTTTLQAIAGLLPFESHSAVFSGHNLKNMPANKRLSIGMALVPEGRGIFKRMTIEENLYLGYMNAKTKDKFRVLSEQVFQLFPRLHERRKQKAGTLSGGEQQMLAIGRAIVGQPELLLLDEPSMGLAPIMVEKIFQVIESIAAQGTTILLVEQNAHIALQIANRGYMMDSGLIEFEAPSKQLIKDPRIREIYLGEDASTSAKDVNESA